jgi:hypothetical protein
MKLKASLITIFFLFLTIVIFSTYHKGFGNLNKLELEIETSKDSYQHNTDILFSVYLYNPNNHQVIYTQPNQISWWGLAEDQDNTVVGEKNFIDIPWKILKSHERKLIFSESITAYGLNIFKINCRYGTLTAQKEVFVYI